MEKRSLYYTSIPIPFSRSSIAQPPAPLFTEYKFMFIAEAPLNQGHTL